MPHLSQHKLPKEVLDQINYQLFNLLLSSPNNKKLEIAGIEALFTNTEKVMLAKRLAAIILLSKGLSSYKVWKILKLSSATTRKLQLGVEKGRYKQLLHLIEKRRSKKKLISDLDSLLRVCFPEQGKRRWNWLDDLYA